MQRNLPHVVFLFFLVVIVGSSAQGQVVLDTSPYIQNFDALGSGQPAGWFARVGSSDASAGSAAAITTAATSWATTSGNFRNVAAAEGLNATTSATDQAASTDRAFAVRQTGAFGDPGAAFVLELANTTGNSNFKLSFKLQSLDGSGTGRTTTWRVDYGLGAAPVSFIAATSAPAALATTLSSAGWGSTDVTVDFAGALDNYNDIVWIRIVAIAASTGSGSRPTSAIDDVSLSFTAGDTTPPLFTPTYPKTNNVTDSGLDIVSNLNEPGKTYFVVLADGASAPVPSQVKNGQDAAGSPVAAGWSGVIINTTASAEYSATINGLADATDYDVYLVAEDNIPNLQLSTVLLNVATNTTGDITPPDFADGYPKVDSISSASLVVKVSLTEPGKTYFVALPGGSVEPSAANVKDGTNADGVTALSSGTVEVLSVAKEYKFVADGLLPATSYDVFIVAEDNVPNLQATPIKISIATGALFNENFNSCNGTSSFSMFSVSGDQTWGCVDFGYNGTKGLRMNGFSGNAIQNEDWLISPVLELGTTPGISFLSQFSFAGNTLQLKISTDYSGSGDPTKATWTDLDGRFPTVAVGSSSTSNADWTSSNIDLSAFAGQTAYIAFVYTSTTGAAARWTVDEVNISDALARYMTTTSSALSFLATNVTQDYVLKGFNVQHDVVVTSSAGFQVSKDNDAFGNSITFSADEVNAAAFVFVTFDVAGASAGSYTGTITNQSLALGDKTVLLSGTDKSQTFDVATYNLEFFASNVKDATGVEFGPLNDTLQVNNVAAVMKNVDADILGVEEISNDTAFAALVSKLPGYDKIVSDRWSYSFQPPDPHFPPQKTGFIYNTSTAKLINSRVMFAAQYDSIQAGRLTLPGYPDNSSSSFWSSGRLPFIATFDVTIKGVTKRIKVIDIHSKSGSAQDDYDRRKYDVTVLHDSLSAHYPGDKIILIGDYNDDVDNSILAGATSSYKIFVDDTQAYDVLTYPLSSTGAYSFPNSSSFLDHVIISNELVSDFVPNSVAIEDGRNYIPNYINTTSDHLPVSVRFLWKADQTITFDAIPSKTYGDPDFILSASATSGLPVHFVSDDPTVVFVHGDTVKILKPGIVNIVASQPGDDGNEAAANVFRVLSVNKQNQTISFAVIPDATLGDAPFSIPATTTSGLPVAFASTSNKIAISGNQVTLVNAGRVIITASQPGNDYFNPAVPVDQSFCIKPAKPVITLDTKLSAATLTSSAATGNQWFLGGVAIPGATGITLNVTESGIYTVKAKVDDCQGASADIVSVVITGDISVPHNGISLYPNPTTEFIELRGVENELSTLTLIDMTGHVSQLPASKNGDSYQINVQQLSQGIYLLQIMDGQLAYRLKFAKQ